MNTLKICVHDKEPVNEVAVSHHLKNAGDHPGKHLVRVALDSFAISGPHGKHTCLLYEPLGMSFAEFQGLLPDQKLPQPLLQRIIQLTLVALIFVHENNTIHTGKV